MRLWSRRIGVVLAVAIIAGCTRAAPARIARAATGTTTASPASTTSTTSTPPQLVAWSGPVEHLFFHTLVVDPALAFTNDRVGQAFRDYFVTVKEFRAILDQLYANHWTLVDLHRVVAGAVRVPPGRRPVVMSEDDVNYYDYERPRGLGWRLVVDRATGAVRVEVHDAGGIHVTDDDMVPLVDQFVAQHPDFSADGAKGVLALTGYQGFFGERISDPTAPEFRASTDRATAIATALKANGWILASHSYGHLDLSKTATNVARQDTERWKSEAAAIIGQTDVYVYPFGGRPPAGSATIPMLRDEGFTILCDIDTTPRLTRGTGVTVMSRRHIDGFALTQQAGPLKPFFDAATVTDMAARKH